MSLIVPAILPSSRADLDEKLKIFFAIPEVSRIQIDAVDGKFASPASWPYNEPGMLEEMLARGETLPHLDSVAYEVDLICSDVEQAAGAWLSLGATRLTIHIGSTTDISAIITTLRSKFGSDISSDLFTLGVALHITSNPEIIEPVLDRVGYVQCMGIAQVGRQGQPLDERVYEQVRSFHAKHPDIPIQIDGGVTLTNAKKLVALGVSHLVVGSSILRASDPYATFEAFEALVPSLGV